MNPIKNEYYKTKIALIVAHSDKNESDFCKNEKDSILKFGKGNTPPPMFEIHFGHAVRFKCYFSLL